MVVTVLKACFVKATLEGHFFQDHDNITEVSLQSDFHVAEHFCQVKLFHSHLRKDTKICLVGVSK